MNLEEIFYCVYMCVHGCRLMQRVEDNVQELVLPVLKTELRLSGWLGRGFSFGAILFCLLFLFFFKEEGWVGGLICHISIGPGSVLSICVESWV